MNSKKVFIIEDEEKIREELTKFLEKYGYTVESSNDFENIVDISLEYEPSIIIPYIILLRILYIILYLTWKNYLNHYYVFLNYS